MGAPPSSEGTRLFLCLASVMITLGNILLLSEIFMLRPTLRPGTSSGRRPADNASISLVLSSSIGPNENSSAHDEYDFRCAKRLEAEAALKFLSVGGVGGRGVDGGALMAE